MRKPLFPLALGGVAALFLAAILSGCQLFDDEEKEDKLTLRFSMNHLVDSDDLVLNTADYPYTNAAGDQYNVEELKYILSDIKLYDSHNSVLAQLDTVLYFDVALENTLVHEFQALSPIYYHSLSFVFGIVPEKNQTGKHDYTRELQRFGWPEHLGGGYHFMQINGKYLDSAGGGASLTVHMGRSVPGGDKGGIGDPHFVVDGIPIRKTLAGSDPLNVVISMQLNQWFKDPNVYGFRDYGAIMPDTAAQLILRENGVNAVFSMDSVYQKAHDDNY